MDLRNKSPRAKWKTVVSVQSLPRELPALRVARDLGIDRRTVKKLREANSSDVAEKKHSVFEHFAKTLLDAFTKHDLKTVSRQIYYQYESPHHYVLRRPGQKLAQARLSLESILVTVDDYCIKRRLGSPEPPLVSRDITKALRERFHSDNLAHIEENRDVFRELCEGVMLADSHDFLSANIEIIEAAIRAHPDKKPRQIFQELRFCFGIMYGNLGRYWVDSGVSPDRLRWHVWKIRTKQKR